jgi:hypothetical protein
MGWEERKGKRYWYDAERVGGRVVKRYVGAGLLADSAEAIRAYVADRRKWARIDRELAAARRSRPSRALTLAAVADTVLAAWLPACGWHRPKRGPWRRKRGHTGGVPMELAVRRTMAEWDTDSLWRENGTIPAELVPKAGKPKAGAVAAYLKDHPAAVSLYGDLSRRVVARLADAVGGDSTLGSAAIKTRAAELRLALAGDAPTPVELLLAERAVVCWAACHQYELVYYSTLDTSRSHKDHEFHERRIASAHRRLLASLKTLAAVRRLKLPDLLAVVRVAGGDGPQPPRTAAAEPVASPGRTDPAGDMPATATGKLW